MPGEYPSAPRYQQRPARPAVWSHRTLGRGKLYSMESGIKRFKSMQAALKQLEPFLRIDYARLLRTGRPMRNFGGMLPRELLGNWLVCAAANFDQPDRPMGFTTDPTGGDGILFDEKNKIPYHFEHVFAPHPATAELPTGGELVKDAVARK